MRRAALLGAGLFLGGVAGAAHITDRLAVGLYASPNDEQPLRLLASDTPVEVLDRGGRLCRVRLGDGTAGWVECGYLTDEKPARAMLLEAQARVAGLRRELQAVRGAAPAQAPGTPAEGEAPMPTAAAAGGGAGPIVAWVAGGFVLGALAGWLARARRDG